MDEHARDDAYFATMRVLDEAGLADTFRGVYRIVVPESCVFFRWEFPEELYAIDLPPSAEPELIECGADQIVKPTDRESRHRCRVCRGDHKTRAHDKVTQGPGA